MKAALILIISMTILAVNISAKNVERKELAVDYDEAVVELRARGKRPGGQKPGKGSRKALETLIKNVGRNESSQLTDTELAELAAGSCGAIKRAKCLLSIGRAVAKCVSIGGSPTRIFKCVVAHIARGAGNACYPCICALIQKFKPRFPCPVLGGTEPAGQLVHIGEFTLPDSSLSCQGFAGAPIRIRGDNEISTDPSSINFETSFSMALKVTPDTVASNGPLNVMQVYQSGDTQKKDPFISIMIDNLRLKIKATTDTNQPEGQVFQFPQRISNPFYIRIVRYNSGYNLRVSFYQVGQRYGYSTSIQISNPKVVSEANIYAAGTTNYLDGTINYLCLPN